MVLSALLPHLQACRTLLGRWQRGGGRAYRWLTEYLPERMVNQMKELSSIAYTWGGGGALVPAALGAHRPRPGGKGVREATSPPGLLFPAPRAGRACRSPGPWGWGAAGAAGCGGQGELP